MPYIGAKVRHNGEMVTVKVFGTEKLFLINPTNLKEVISEAIDSLSNSDDEPVFGIAKEVAKALDHNEHALWVECEILNADGSLFGGVAELENVG